MAARAGVSVGSVSRALKNQPGLSDETRARILAAADTLGYDIGRLRARPLKRVVCLLHRQHSTLTGNQFFSHVVQGAEAAAREHGIAMSLFSVAPTDPLHDMIVALHEPDGFLCAGFLEDEVLSELVATGHPLVLIDYQWRDLPAINADNEGGAFTAISRLIASGHRRIAFIHGPLSHHSILQRMRGYRAALFHHGIPGDPELEILLDRSDDPEGASARAVDELLARPTPPEAIFAYNDVCALATMRACQRRGVRIPEDISIIGFDDIGAAALSTPPLTTLRIGKEEMGRIGMQCLADITAGKPATKVVLPVELVVRGSARIAPDDLGGVES
ncbi:LacI family DNA-binding transcriptional regulator [Niveibacterium umoris]